MELNKGDKFRNYIGDECFIVYMRGDIIKLSYILNPPYIEVWSKEEFLRQLGMSKFFPLPKQKVTRVNISEHLVEYQLNLIGKTSKQALANSNWYNEWTITENQVKFLKSYAIPLLKKIFKFNKAKAEDTFLWFLLQYGLKLKNS